MKKFLVAAVAAAFLLCSTAPLSAAELSSYGFMKFVGQFTDNLGFVEEDKGTSDFALNQRARTWFDFTASENLKATVGLEWDSAWGNSDFDSNGAMRNAGLWLSGDRNMIETKHLYVDFTFPGTEVDVRAGQFWVELPSNFGSSILGGDMPALQMNAPISDAMGLTLGWTRTYDLNGGFGETKDSPAGDDNDIFYTAMPIDMDGFSFTPFGAYGLLGDGSTFDSEGVGIGYPGATSLGAAGTSLAPFGDDIDAWWLGVSGDVTMMDPIAFLYDFNYGEMDGDDFETTGYVADLAFQYRMDMLTLQVMGFYGSGDDWSDYDSSNPEGGRMPVYFTESFTPPATLGYANCGTCTGSISDGQFSFHQAGMWSVGMSLQNITFSDKLSGDLQLRYNEGTNDKELAENGIYLSPYNNQLTEKDSAIEIGAQVDYALYENLTATLDAGYINLDMDEDVWGQKFEEDLTRIAAGLTYSW
ncbi:MAG: outer membrane homotrimeric porin [Desulfovermiculus sp.]